MLNEGLDRDSIVTKAMGVLCGIAAVVGIAVCFMGFGFLNLIIAVANGLLAFVCFVAHDREKEIILGAVGAVIAAELIGLVIGVHTTTVVVNTLVSLLCYVAIFLYIFGNNVTRNRAMWGGAVLVVDTGLKLINLSSTLQLVERTGLVSEEAIGVYKTAACATALTIVPAFAITLLLFMGLLNYGN